MKKILAISFAIFGNIASNSNAVWADAINGDDEIFLMVGDENRVYSGDFILVESNGKFGLIDAGTSGGDQEEPRQRAIYDFLDKIGVKDLEFVILTHAHGDHNSAMTTAYGNETETIFERYHVKELILKDYPDISKITTITDTERVNYIGERLNAYNDMLAHANATGTKYGFKNSVMLGDFKISIVNNYELNEEENKRNFNLNYESLGVLVEKDDYKMFLSGDIEWEDFDQTIGDLRKLGVEKLDAFKYNHHGYSINPANPSGNLRLMQTFGTPIVGLTNERSRLYNDSDTAPAKVAALEKAATTGLYWQGDGIVRFNFSNLSEKGLVVSQVGNTEESVVKHINGAQVFSRNTLNIAPTKEDFIKDDMRAQTAEVIAGIDKNSNTPKTSKANNGSSKIEAPSTGFMQNFENVWLSIGASVIFGVVILSVSRKRGLVKF